MISKRFVSMLLVQTDAVMACVSLKKTGKSWQKKTQKSGFNMLTLKLAVE